MRSFQDVHSCVIYSCQFLFIALLLPRYVILGLQSLRENMLTSLLLLRYILLTSSLLSIYVILAFLYLNYVNLFNPLNTYHSGPFKHISQRCLVFLLSLGYVNPNDIYHLCPFSPQDLFTTAYLVVMVIVSTNTILAPFDLRIRHIGFFTHHSI